MRALDVLIAYIGSTLVIIISSDLLRRYFNYRYYHNQHKIFLELTPPLVSRKTPLASEQLLSALFNLELPRSYKDRFIGRNGSIAFEVVSSRYDGIRFVVCLVSSDKEVFEHLIVSYLPDVKHQIVEDYMATDFNEKHFRLFEFKHARHFAYPLASHDTLAEHDPIAYITGSMTRLQPGELVALQIVLSPLYSREAVRIRNKIMLGEDPKLNVKVRSILFMLFRYILSLPMRIIWFIVDMAAPAGKQPRYGFGPSLKSNIALTPGVQELFSSIQDKLAQPLFQTGVRALVVANSDKRSETIATGLLSALASFNVPGFQALVTKRSFPSRIRLPYRWVSFNFRILPIFTKQGCVLSASELASLYHFPYGNSAQTENLVRSLSKNLPTPLALKVQADEDSFDVVIGQNQYSGTTTNIGLSAAERERHLYIIGGTGNGKTTMLQYMIVQDMRNGKGLAIVDPHGDLSLTVLRHVPKDRLNDVIYFNPDDLGYPIGLNLLEIPKGISGDELIREKDLITESVVSIFRKIFSEDDSGGHRIEYVLRNAVHTAHTIEGATLFTVLKLVQNSSYRKKYVDKLENEDLKDFWKNEFAMAGDMQRVKMSAGVTAKIGRFRHSAAATRILGQERSTIDFEDIMNSGKILICNFSKGLLGEDVSELFGITILAKLQLASLSRARQEPAKRRPFYLYVDEFQNFATASFVQMLSEARKYQLLLTMAEQSTSQQKDQQMVQVILANVGSVICFRTGNPNDEQLFLPLFQPFIALGEIANLSAYNFYAKLSAVKAQEPLSGQTLLLENEGSKDIAEEVIQQSRKRYAKKVIQPKAEAVRVVESKRDSWTEPNPSVAIVDD